MAIPAAGAGIGAAYTRLWPAALAMAGPAYAGMLMGAILIALAYANAAASTNQLHFYLFWLGVLLFLVPAAITLCAVESSRNARLALLVALGLMNYLPKYLRTPDYFLFHDELAHWRQAEIIFSTGRLFVPNPSVYISQFFPGLQAMTVTLRDLTGLTTFQIAAVLILCTHAAALLGIFVIAETLTGSHQLAGIAALIYALNPGFMYFDTQYAYESIAFVYVIWVVAALIKLQHAAGDRAAQVGWFGAGLLLAITCVITHHVSSYVLIIILWLITSVTWLLGRRLPTGRASIAPLLCFTVLVTLSALAWLVFVAPDVLGYLTEPVDAALTQLSHLLHHQSQSRALFAHSQTPAFERWSAFGSVAIAGLGAGSGLLVLRRRQPPPALVALALFGLLYFAVMPLMLTGSGNEGARRSWTFSYIGLCVLVAPALVVFLAWARRQGRLARWAGAGVVVALLGVAQIGNVSMNINDLYRFPGPYIYGSDTRSTTAELLGTAAWLRETQGTGKAVVADRYVSQILSSFALEWTPLASQAFPIWQLYFDPGPPSPLLLQELRFSHYQYLVVDERMAQSLPYLGVYFQDGEGPDGSLAAPPSRAVIDRFERVPWAIKIYQSDHLSIYRLNLAVVPARPDTSPPAQPAAPGNEIARREQAPQSARTG